MNKHVCYDLLLTVWPMFYLEVIALFLPLHDDLLALVLSRFG